VKQGKAIHKMDPCGAGEASKQQFIRVQRPVQAPFQYLGAAQDINDKL
jgi:hypothetical protein